MPDEEQVEGRARVMECIISKFKQGPLYTLPGFPLVIYPKLDENWHNCAESIDELAPISEQFVSQVQNIFKLVVEAGLIHLDGRLANFMFYKCGDGTVKVKLIDWDSCARVGYPIPSALKEAFERDNRYPSGVIYASSDIHDFFLNKIKDDLHFNKFNSLVTEQWKI